MTVTQALLQFAAASAVLTVIPGMDSTLVLRSALVRGRRHAVVTGLGISVGLLLWGAAAALGAAALLAASELAFRAVTVVGAAYIAYLGVRMIVNSFRTTHLDFTATEAAPTSWSAFANGLGTNLLNPKIGVFYIATIPQFIGGSGSPLAMGVLLAAVHALITVLWFAVLITGASAARRWLANARALRIIDRIAGAVLIALAAKLALDHP